MIVSFSVSNFRSFSSEETLSLVASNRLVAHPEHAVPIPDSTEKVLRAAVLYGANGAGKSNLFKALQYLKKVALGPRNKGGGTGRTIFRFGDRREEPSTFDLQFIANNRLYRFGFKVDDQRIVEEWLAQVIGKRERTLYERITGQDGAVRIELQGFRDNEKLNALAKVGGPQNQSFLATINVTLDSSDLGDEFSEIIGWFKGDLVLTPPNEPLAPIGALLSHDADFLKFAGGFLKVSSTGVDHLDIVKREISEDELREFLPKNLASKVLKDLSEGTADVAILSLSEGKELLVERKDETHYYTIAIQAAHEDQAGNTIPFELTDESDGTQRLLNLIPALRHLEATSAVYVIDEIDRSLHPILVWKFLEYFLKSCTSCKSQMIVTTYESNLLDLDLLRRDEIWFSEKDRSCSTRLYSLMDFKVRDDLAIRKHYLQGRFGAIPFLGNLDCLVGNGNEDRQDEPSPA